MPQNRQRQDRKRQIRAATRSRAAATPQPTRRSAPLPLPPSQPPTEPHALAAALPGEDHVRDTAPQIIDASLPSQDSTGAPGAGTEGTSDETRQQARMATPMELTSAVLWQWSLAQSFAACSATAVTGLLQLGQIWAAFLQASMRQSSAAAFGWTKQR